MKKIATEIYQKHQRKASMLAVLIDPDEGKKAALVQQVNYANQAKIDYFFVGGSLISEDCLDETLTYVKNNSEIPCVLFPGSVYQVNAKADALLFLSLISGRNPDLLIGQHVVAAPLIKKSGLETLSTGYLLIESGMPTTASYISHSLPIPHNKPTIAAVTAMAGEMLGLDFLFLDAGSGALNPVSSEMISATAKLCCNPIIVGGGIKTAAKVKENFDAGASIVVVGNITETQPELIPEMAAMRL